MLFLFSPVPPGLGASQPCAPLLLSLANRPHPPCRAGISWNRTFCWPEAEHGAAALQLPL